jgi:TetR/AcrR family transcriptional regulator, transcriptional repressor for nem operon
MPRTKEFDRDQVLDLATDVFWKRGYEATSIGDLVNELGIGRQSLYDTFGDKRALYLAALDRYRQRQGCAGVLGIEDESVPLRKAVRVFLENVVEWLLSPAGKTCMLVGAAVERCPGDSEVAEKFGSNLANMERVLHRRFLRAQEHGEIARHLDPAALARYFVSTLNGLQVTSKVVRERAALLQIVDVALTVLG